MMTPSGLRWKAVVAVALPCWLAACGDPVVPDPHAEVRGTYDLVLSGGQPLPYVVHTGGLNSLRIVAGTLELRANGRFIQTVNGVETAGEYGVQGDTVSLRRDGEHFTTYLREGAALVYLPDGAPGAVWVKQGEIETTPFQYQRFRMTSREAPADSLTMLGSDFWLWESGRYDKQSYVTGVHVWRESGTYTVEGDSLLLFDPAISMWDEPEGVLTGELLRIGLVTYEKR
jgi:hypothetical protein